MVPFDLLADLMGELKGARASVILAMLLAGRPLSQNELHFLTGYSVKPVRYAVRALLAQGLITRDGPRVLLLSDAWRRVLAQSAAPESNAKVAEERPLPMALPAAYTAANEVETTADMAANEVEMAADEVETTADMAANEVEIAPKTAGTGRGGQNTLESRRNDLASGTFGPPDQSVVVVVYHDLDYEQQQQQIFDKEAPLPAVNEVKTVPKTAGTGRGGQNSPENRRNGPASGTFGPPDQQRPDRLPALPDTMGSNGRAFW